MQHPTYTIMNSLPKATIANFRVMESSSGNGATELGESAKMASDENESKEGFDLGRRYQNDDDGGCIKKKLNDNKLNDVAIKK
ncbi:hypothetical protein C2G38_2160065 [Gigaspora rosea]|uniref:Uncharacterized protein n=1 Tax=Gigaspora rosea TaxID=44941 RepID=A0A397VYJ7_9GLOM|nr:hypothetical protein C2G38_2160065 [Gigaspora rosea]